LSWYRKFIPHFATVAAPIHSVTNLTKDNRHKFKWKYAQSKVFHELKQILVREPLFLHYPIDDIPLILTTAASGIGIGGVLQQEVEGEMHNLYYHSQLMTICERRNIILKTDHCPLCHIMEKTVRNARVDRITQLLQEYNIDKNEINDDPFEIDYGLENKDNLNESELLSPLISQSSSSSYNKKDKNLLATMVLRSRFKQHKSHTTTGTSNNKVINHDEEDNQSQQMPRVNKSFIRKFSHNEFDLTNLKQEQENDSIMQNIVKELHTRRDNIPFVIKNNIVYRLITTSRHSKRKIEVIYLPASMEKSLIQACHDDPMTGAHFSFERTYNKIKYYYWWPGMKAIIKHYIRSCLLCKQFNISRHKNVGHLRPITPLEGPFLLIGIDYCGPLKRTPRGNQYVLVITDYFTRHITAIALPNCTAETTAQTLFNEYFSDGEY
ncbi:unnamed protein product, partial [Rotaria magnacalcarata]